MGDPKFNRRLYDTPSHPWKAQRIAEETELCRKYGLKNKRELWRIKSQLGRFRSSARSLEARLRVGDEQAEKEAEQLLSRLRRMALLEEGGQLIDVLSIPLEGLLTRRLQTQAYLKGLAGTPDQARQLIIHGHIALDGRKVTIPGYFLRQGEVEKVAYHARSPYANEAHPMRPKPRPAEGAETFEEFAAAQRTEAATVQAHEPEDGGA